MRNVDTRNWVSVGLVRPQDIVEWAGYRCLVLAVHGPQRERSQHKVCYRLDLEVPGIGVREGAHYWATEQIVRIEGSAVEL